MPLNPWFTNATTTATGYVWVKLSHANPAQQQALADKLAINIMSSKFSSATNIFQAWQQKHITGQANTAEMAQILEATIKIGIGTQANPKPDDHRQGWVAEHLWYFLIKGSYPTGNVSMLFDIGIAATDPGGDGLVIHTDPQGSFFFRLWEIKKAVDSVNPNQTISRAADQLFEKGLEYLCRYVVNSQAKNYPPAEQAFIDQMMAKWLSKSADSAVGISIMSSGNNLTTASFISLAKKFPEYSKNGTLEGRTIDVVDFTSFCKMVCESLWKGI